MQISEGIRKSVGYLWYDSATGPKWAGTAFLLGYPWAGLELPNAHIYVVTAHHLLAKIQMDATNDRVYVRLNAKAGGTINMILEQRHWHRHPTDTTVDVAAAHCSIPDVLVDYDSIPYNIMSTAQSVHTLGITLGDEVFLPGLFAQHIGVGANIPVIRVGNIAALREEPVHTTSPYGTMDAYLIDTRSTGGLSGSPVFVHLGWTRWTQGGIHLATSPTPFTLLGLVHGHCVDHDESGAGSNAGIAIVVPSEKILEVLEQDELREKRDEYEEAYAKRVAASPISSLGTPLSAVKWKAAASDAEGSDPHATVLALVAEFFELSTSPTQVPSDASLADTFLALLLSRCRAILRAVVALAQSDMLFLAHGLVAVIFEHAADACWLIEDDDRVRPLWLDHLSRMHRESNEAASPFERMLQEMGAEDGGGALDSLPPLSDRVRGPLRAQFPLYLEMLDHDRLVVGEATLNVRQSSSGLLIDDRPPFLGKEQMLLGYSATLTCFLASRVHARLGLDHVGRLEQLFGELNEAFNRWHPAES
jgi:hypothetical protein